MKYIFSLFLIFFLAHTQAQVLTHKQGEVIVELAGEDEILLKKQLFAQGIQDFKIEKISDELGHMFLVKVDFTKTNTTELTRVLNLDNNVLHAQKNRILTLRSTIPNDELFSNQWQYYNVADQSKDFQIDKAWDITTGGSTPDGKTIVIAVIDNGFDYDHKDIQNNIWINKDEIPNNNKDDDNNGYIDDYYGWNAAESKGDIGNPASHGTSVMGIIGAQGNNSIGVAGVNWNVKIMLIKGGGSEADAIAAYAYPLKMRKLYNETNGQKGAYVVATNSSWGIDKSFAEDSPLWCNFYDTMGEEGILSVAATSNQGVNVESVGDLPGTCTSDYLVVATNLKRDDQLKSNAAFGAKSIDIAAYGAETYSIQMNDQYGIFGGTSAAAPHVTGAVGLIYAADCKLNSIADNGDKVRYVKDIILDTAVPLESLKKKTTSEGKLDIGRAVTVAKLACNNGCLPVYNGGIVVLENGFKINFSGANTATIKYKKTSDSQYTTINNYASGTLINTSDYCTDYVVKIANPCTGTQGYNRYFTTGGCCENPDFIANIEDNAVIVTIKDAEDEKGYFIDYRQKGESTWETVRILGAESPFKLPVNTASCDAIEYRIKKDCNTVKLDYTTPKTVFSECGTCTEGYCNYKGLVNDGEYIKSVKMGDILIERTSDNTPGEYYYDNAYTIKSGTDNEFNLEIGYKANSYNENTYVFVDTNYDGQFSEGELVFKALSAKDLIKGNINIPALEKYGKTRMRVLMGFGVGEKPCKEDLAKKYGDFVDLCIDILPQEDCFTAFDPEVKYYKEAKQFDIVFNANGSAEYSIKAIGADNIQYGPYTTSGTSISISDLKCQNYSFEIKGSCDNTTLTKTINISSDCTVSTTNTKSDVYSIAPNPSSALNIIGGDVDEIMIMGLSGQALYRGTYIPNHTYNLPNGMYHVVVFNDKESSVIKWMKL